MKRGPKPKIGDIERKRIFKELRDGASLKDAADVIGCDITTIFRLRQTDPKFAQGVRKAVKDGKMTCIRRIKRSKDWRASAWLLERRWGSEFGRRDRLEHTGSEGGPIQTQSTLDLRKLSETELDQLERIVRNANGSTTTASPSIAGRN